MQIPAPFEYERASSDDAIALLERHGEEARLIAGGHSCIAADEAAVCFA